MLELTYYCHSRPRFGGYYRIPKRELDAYGTVYPERVLGHARHDVENYYLTYGGFLGLDLEGHQRNAPPHVTVTQNDEVMDIISELPYVNSWAAFVEEVA